MMKRAMQTALVSVLMLSANAAHAQINFQKVSSLNYQFGGTARDNVTGVYYRVPYYQGAITRYATQNDFEAGSSGSSVGIYREGTYFAAQNGFLYGNAGGGAGTLGKWDLATGTRVGTAQYAGFKGANGTDSFNWGGLSVMNVFNDNGVMYLMSGNGSAAGGSIARLNSDMTLSNVQNFATGGSLGWGFVAGGQFFGNTNYMGNTQINRQISMDTGKVSTAAITLTGLWDNYITNANYIGATDTLYVWSSSSLYKATGVAQALGLASAVPEPATWAMMFLGMGLIGSTLRRRKVDTRVSYAG